MHKETHFNPLLTCHSWVLTACVNVRAINPSFIRKCHLIGKGLMTKYSISSDDAGRDVITHLYVITQQFD